MGATALTVYLTNIVEADEGSVEFATSDEATMAKANFHWMLKEDIASAGGFNLDMYSVASYSKWTKVDYVGNSDEFSNNALDISLLNRFENRYFVLEYGLGLSAMSNISLDRSVDGGVLYFNHVLGLGVKYEGFKVIGRFEHYSNNGIHHPNIGYNFYAINIGWEY
jgi:hypothetical protein